MDCRCPEIASVSLQLKKKKSAKQLGAKPYSELQFLKQVQCRVVFQKPFFKKNTHLHSTICFLTLFSLEQSAAMLAVWNVAQYFYSKPVQMADSLPPYFSWLFFSKVSLVFSQTLTRVLFGSPVLLFDILQPFYNPPGQLLGLRGFHARHKPAYNASIESPIGIGPELKAPCTVLQATSFPSNRWSLAFHSCWLSKMLVSILCRAKPKP